MTTTRLATGHNEILEWDILFTGKMMVSHCIDEATRWPGGMLESKAVEESIKAITMFWIWPHEPMQLLVTNQESGSTGESATQCLDRWSIQLKTKETGAHVQLVERHYDLLRKLVPKVRAQFAEERAEISLEMIVAERLIIKNFMISAGGFSPYQTVYGRFLR